MKHHHPPSTRVPSAQALSDVLDCRQALEGMIESEDYAGGGRGGWWSDWRHDQRVTDHTPYSMMYQPPLPHSASHPPPLHHPTP
jgi:hypothetical protein